MTFHIDKLFKNIIKEIMILDIKNTSKRIFNTRENKITIKNQTHLIRYLIFDFIKISYIYLNSINI